MLPVLLWFLIPLGFGIPAGVLLAHARGIGWPQMAALYFLSDMIQAAAFEPLMRALIAAGRNVPAVVRTVEALKQSMARVAALAGGGGSGPFALILVAFLSDPMTGRVATVAAGHGFVSGWTLAITGDTLSFLVIAAATLKISSALGDPYWTVAAVLAAMYMIPVLARRVRDAWARRRESA